MSPHFMASLSISIDSGPIPNLSRNPIRPSSWAVSSHRACSGLSTTVTAGARPIWRLRIFGVLWLNYRNAAKGLVVILLLLAQSGRKLVRPDRTRCHCPRSLHLGQGPGPQADALYPSLQSCSQAHQVDL